MYNNDKLASFVSYNTFLELIYQTKLTHIPWIIELLMYLEHILYR